MNKRLFSIACVISILLCSCQKGLKEIIDNTESATFIIYTYDEFGSPSGSGSGFFIDENGTGITNYHVLEGAVKAKLKTSDGLEYEINEVISSDKNWDIIKFSTNNCNNIKFKYLNFSDKKIEKGDVVYNISSPLGLEKSISNGIVSSLRQDEKHGDIVQVTASMSSGSSGSALLDEMGNVFAVVTFNRAGGQNLNFGVVINSQKLEMMKENDFARLNPKFNKKENFIIVNSPSEQTPDVVLNAIEFKKDVTIAYLSFTNLILSPSLNHYYIWCELNKKDDGFLINDLDREKKYYITSSTIGTSKEDGTKVPLASNFKFKVFFPPIKDKLNNIELICGYSSRGWQFRNINLNELREKVSLDLNNYQKEYAYSTMHEGDLSEATSVFSAILEETPDDMQALNAMGIISYVVDNNNDAEYYFSKAIDGHPNNSLGYINRFQVRSYQKNYQEALSDIKQAINIDNAQPDNYGYRAELYMNMEQWENAKNDWNIVLKTDDFKEDAYAYYRRAICNVMINDKGNARSDIERAYNLTNDKELEEELQAIWTKLGF